MELARRPGGSHGATTFQARVSPRVHRPAPEQVGQETEPALGQTRNRGGCLASTVRVSPSLRWLAQGFFLFEGRHHGTVADPNLHTHLACHHESKEVRTGVFQGK